MVWHTCHHPSDKIKQCAHQIIASIPDTYEFRLTKILCHSYGPIWLLNDDNEDEPLDHEQREQKKQAAINALVEEFVQVQPNPIEGLQYLHTKIEELRSDGVEPNPLHFTMALSQNYPHYAAAMAEALIETPDNHLATYIAWLLYGLRHADIDTTLALEKRIAESGNATLAFSLTHAFRWNEWQRTLQTTDIEVLQSLIAYSDPNVSIQALSVLGYVGKFLPDLVIPIVLGIDVEDSSERARALYQVFYKGHGIDHERLTDEQMEVLLSKLEFVKNIEDYNIQEVLGYMALRIPRRLVEFLIQRIRHSGSNYYPDFKALPHYSLEEHLASLANYEQYRELLRLVRDSTLDKTILRISQLPILYQAISLNYQTAGLDVLKEWIDSDEEQKITLVSMLLHEASPSFIFDNEEFIFYLLEQAYNTSSECFSEVQGSLAGTALYGSKMGTAGEPFPQDIALRDRARTTLEHLSISSPLREFYEMLLHSAEENIAESHRQNEERYN